MVRCALHASGASAVSPGAADGYVDWADLGKLAEAHGLLSLLGTRLASLDNFHLPPEFRATLAQYAQANTLRNRMLLQEYQELSALFAHQGIEIIALKGIAAIQRNPDYAPVRELADIDILIDTQQIAVARALLEQRGYQAVYAPNTLPVDAVDLSPDQARVYARVYHEFSFVSADGLIYVDVHWRLSPSVYPTGIVAVPQSGRTAAGIPALSPPYELVYLCTHAAKDGWSELKWAIDIAWLMRHLTLADWESAWQVAQRCRSRRALLAGIALAEWLIGEPLLLPGSKIEQRYGPPSGALERLCKRLMHAPERKHRLVSCLGLNKTYIALCDSNRDKLVYIFRMFSYAQPRDFLRLGLTPALLPVWGVLRPLAISAHCAKRAIRALLAGRR